ncbi:16457_t:CDS:1 [Funneliformis geosporum]|uniref:3703_t:CDS:1 n=1 Tax=Funneliformis geosporum TaxID=1117311 RepID=A0A9W4WQ43_9GLOM|nr:16457_t:CDS:1 [Funneliformis geosporum]CAI2170463.1 3703_t:CDS:1 [Funneliformis geosporum]
MDNYELVAAALSKITNTQVITYNEYLSQKETNPDQTFQYFDCNLLHEIYLVKGVVSSNVIDVEENDDAIVSSSNAEAEVSTNDFEKVFIALSGETLEIKNLNANTTISQLKNKIFESKGIVPNDQWLTIQNVFIKNISGKTLTVKNLNAKTSINQLKNRIYETEGIPPNEQYLNYGLKSLQDHQTLSFYEITNDTTINLSTRLRGGASKSIGVLDRDFLDPHYDYDFTNIKSSGRTYMRGNYKYVRPYGWNRIAIRVLDKYSDNRWLGVNNRTKFSDSVEGEWIVSFHGTAKNNANSIARDGFLLSKGNRFQYGRGVYSTPDIDTAACYAEKFEYGGVNYQVVFQNRVKPGTFDVVSSESGLKIFISRNDKNIRPYGICIRKL